MRYSLSYIPVRVCLGYLRGRSFPPKIQLSLAISEKSSRRDEISAHEVSIPCRRTLYDKEHGVFLFKHYCNISQNCVSKCTRLHLSAYSFQNMAGGGHAARPPQEACGLRPLGTSPPNDKSQIEHCPWALFEASGSLPYLPITNFSSI